MQVRFWGTRGSLPVAPRGEDIRQKIKQALLQANGRQFDSEAAIKRFIDAELAARHELVELLSRSRLPEPTGFGLTIDLRRDYEEFQARQRVRIITKELSKR